MRKIFIFILLIGSLASQAQGRKIFAASNFDINTFTLSFMNSTDTVVTIGTTYLRILKNTSVAGSFALTGTQTITSGTATTLNQTISRVIVNPASVLASHTITMPASPVDGQIIDIYFGGTIAGGAAVVTTLTISANTGQSLMQPSAPTTANGGQSFSYQYNSSNTTWYRRY